MRTGFLLAEDEAVKLRFSNMGVSDDRDNGDPRPVQVFFRYPEGETEKLFPFITIECIDVLHAKARQHSEVTLYGHNNDDNFYTGRPNELTYWPDEATDLGNVVPNSDPTHNYWMTNEFIPIDMLYQVTTYCRSALHDRQLSAQMLSSTIPFRWNAINVLSDNTIRRFDLLDWTTADLLDPEAGYKKRIFRKIFTLQMTAELPSTELALIPLVTQTFTTVNPV